MEYIVCFLVLIASLALLAGLIIWHLPKSKVNDEVRADIEKYGLMHFTTRENAEAILEQGLVPGHKKALSFFEKGMVWTYVADPNHFMERMNEIQLKSGRSDYNSVVFFHDISSEDYPKMRCKPGKGVVVYKGTLKTDDMFIFNL